MISDVLWTQLKKEVGGDEVLLRVIIKALPDLRMDAELEPHMARFYELRDLAIKTHGKQREEWDEIRIKVARINLFGDQLANAEHQQVERYIKRAQERIEGHE